MQDCKDQHYEIVDAVALSAPGCTNVSTCTSGVRVFRYPKGQLNYKNGNVMCTSCCLLYSHLCSTVQCEPMFILDGVPVVQTLDRLFTLASELHSRTLRQCGRWGGDIVSVHDVISTTNLSTDTQHIFEMVEVQGTFNEEILAAFKLDMAATKAWQDSAPGNNTLLFVQEDFFVYSFLEAVTMHLTSGSSGTLTIEDCCHTLAIHRCRDGESYNVFDPLGANIVRLPSLEHLCAHVQAISPTSQFTCYFTVAQ